VEHGVQRERQPELLDPARHLELPREGSQPGDAVGGGGPHVLDGDLHAVQAEVAQAGQARAGEGNAARDEVRVEVPASRRFHQRFEVVADERLAAGEIDLYDAEILGLAEHALPGRRVELVVVLGEVERVGAVDAA
jgi:hypothetical protein